MSAQPDNPTPRYDPKTDRWLSEMFGFKSSGWQQEILRNQSNRFKFFVSGHDPHRTDLRIYRAVKEALGK